jgi:primosomal protein N' (replication factor Y)
MEAARGVRERLPDNEQRKTLGPAPAVVPKIQDRHRWHVLVKCFTAEAFADAMAQVGTVEDLGTRRLRVTLDVDPVAML